MLNNIFITGGSSYLGKNLIDQLTDYNLFVLKNKNNILQHDNIHEIDHLPENINLFFNEHKIDYVIHLASNSKRERNIEFFEDIIDTNIMLGLEILESAINSPVKKLISAGSYSQDVIEHPLSLYTISKNYFEKLQKIFSENYNLQNTSLHFGDIYGPSDDRNKLIPYILKHENKNVIEFESDGNGLFSPLFIKDAVESIIYELKNENKKTFKKEIIGSDLVLVKDFIETYKKIRNKNFEPTFKGISKIEYKDVSGFVKSNNLKYPLEKGLNLI